MTFNQYKRDFTAEALKSGYSRQNIDRCLTYAGNLFSNNVPVIYNTSHLSGLVGYKKSYLKKAALFTSYFYRDFEILKKNGGKRKISEPLPSLKEIQLWILENILYKVKISRHAKAYTPKVNIKENLKYHIRKPLVFAIDIENFFPSIKRIHVEEIFKSLGYSSLISNLLSKLCCRDGSLPQGAPTSPYLSNIYLKTLDDAVSKYCTERRIHYTRYADDLTFSGKFDIKELNDVLFIELRNLTLTINRRKTKIMTPNTRQTVTGIVVNEKPQVSFNKRNKLRQTIYYIKKFGLENHMNRLNIKKKNYLEHLLGQVNFVLFINPSDNEFIEYKEYLEALRSPRTTGI